MQLHAKHTTSIVLAITSPSHLVIFLGNKNEVVGAGKLLSTQLTEECDCNEDVLIGLMVSIACNKCCISADVTKSKLCLLHTRI